jgi:hypothetical protein
LSENAGGSYFEATAIRFIFGMAELFLSQAKFTLKIVQPATNCPKFENLQLLPYRVQSAVSEKRFPGLCFCAWRDRPGSHDEKRERTEFTLQRVQVCGSSFESIGIRDSHIGCQ